MAFELIAMACGYAHIVANNLNVQDIIINLFFSFFFTTYILFLLKYLNKFILKKIK